MADYAGMSKPRPKSPNLRTPRPAARLGRDTGRPPMVKVGSRESSLNAKIGVAATRGGEWLKELGLDYAIDEVAILLPEDPKENQDWLERMLDRVGTEGVTYFNRSVSRVVVHCLPSVYDVTYHFFTTAIAGVRLELMRLGNGHSPLHSLYNLREDGRGREGAVVHASFKVSNEPEYRNVTRYMQGLGWACGQDCSSDYGLFSYWRQPGDQESLLWLKPRVNLRDEAKPFDELMVPTQEGHHEAPAFLDDDQYEEEEDDDI
jgi:hypothetical protein